MNEEALFYQALELPEDRRAAFLDGACANDSALRPRIEALLHAHQPPEDFLAGQAQTPREDWVGPP